MLRKNRLYGLMAGLTIGCAMWGFMPVSSHLAQTPAPEPSEVLSASIPTYKASAILEAESKCPVNLAAQSAVLMDGDTGRILVGKNEKEFRPMASTTKIMTCILALEKASPELVCKVSTKAASQPKVHLGARSGTEFYLKDLLYSLMLESHNDTAVVIAETVAGNVDDFADMMNEKARKIGCQDTNFITPNGLDAQKTLENGETKIHGTTAADLARIMRYCIIESPKKEEFLEVTRTSNYFFTDLSGRQQYSCQNHNALLRQMDGVLSGKTGFTGGAGYSYVGAYENGGRTFILALLGCGWPPHKTWKWNDARALFRYGTENYEYQEVYQEVSLSTLKVLDGIGDYVQPVLKLKEDEKTVRVLLGREDEIRVNVQLPDTLLAPVEKEKHVGDVVYYLNGEVLRKFPIYTDREIKKRNLRYYLKQILKKLFVRTTTDDFSLQS